MVLDIILQVAYFLEETLLDDVIYISHSISTKPISKEFADFIFDSDLVIRIIFIFWGKEILLSITSVLNTILFHLLN